MDDSDVVGCLGILLVAAILIGIGAGAHALFHKCPSDKLEEEVPVSHPAPTGVEVKWENGDWGILKDYDRNLQWRIVWICSRSGTASTIMILPDSQQPITTPEKTK